MLCLGRGFIYFSCCSCQSLMTRCKNGGNLDLKPEPTSQDSVMIAPLLHCKFGRRTFSVSQDHHKERTCQISHKSYPDKDVDNEKSPVLFLHGLFGAKGNVHTVSRMLSEKGQRIIPFDARNHGDSGHTSDHTYPLMVDDLISLKDDLQLKSPIVMGHSMGGKTAMLAALNKPDSMQALIVVDSSIQASPSFVVYKSFVEAMMRVGIPSGTSLSQGRKMASNQLASTIPNEGLRQFILTNFKQFEDGSLGWRLNLDALHRFLEPGSDVVNTGSSIFTKPTLFLFGGKSDVYKPDQLGWIKEKFPNSEVEVIPDASHFVHADKPKEFVKIVSDFLLKLHNQNS